MDGDPWTGWLKFDDRRGRIWCLRRLSTDHGLTLINPKGRPVPINNRNALPVLQLLVKEGLNKTVTERVGLPNVELYRIVWQPAQRKSESDEYKRTQASYNVVPVVTRLCNLLGGRENFQSIPYGYKFLGLNVRFEKEEASDSSEPPVIPDPAPSPRTHSGVPASGLVVGRDEEIADALRQWMADRNRPLVIWGTPGIGKSTLALAVLNSPETQTRFGERRYRLRCDGMRSAAEIKAAMADQWFGLVGPADASASPPQISIIEAQIAQRLREGPCAIVIDNFETPHRADTDACEEWLKLLLGIEGVWLIVATQGYYRPGSLHWSKPIEPQLLSLQFARDLFCGITEREAHRRDPRLDSLLEDMAGVPYAIVLLAHQAGHVDDLDRLFARWATKGTPALRRMGGPDRHTSLPVVYRFAIEENPLIDDGARRLLRALACLPAGAHEADYPVISETVGETSPWDAADMLVQAALVYNESDRLRILSPLRDFILRTYPVSAEELKRVYDAYLRMITGGRAWSIFEDHGAQVLADLVEEFQNIQWAVETSLGLGDPAGIEGACHLVNLISVGDLKARNFLPRGIALAREIGDRLAEFCCRAASSELAYSQQRNDEAISGFRMTLDLCRELEDRLAEGNCLMRLGELEYRFNRYEAAGRLTLQALDALSSCEGTLAIWGRAACHHNLAGYALQCGAVRTASEQAATALLLFKKSGNLRGEAKCLRLMGTIAHELHQYEKVEAFFNEAISILESLGFPLPLAWCLMELADTQEMWEQRKKARDCFQRALSLFRSAGHRDGELACRNALMAFPALE